MNTYHVKKSLLVLLVSSICWAFFFSSVAQASIETYQFDSKQQEQQYRTIINQLRCPKCQNQSIADSDAPLSEDLRKIVYKKIKAGETDKQIYQFMRERYGNWVLYNPPLEPSNYLLWFFPIFIFLLVVVVVVIKVGRRQPVDLGDSETSHEVSSEKQQ